ncbi:CHRD domain-containing protein [Streptomyces spectabilis]|uniref:CHRD domain-containing protein n=1 Tax=Streptomyces spectabilis TaxID=68270 RepID=A0A516RBQ4_STRST|nr:CHRD domain-containing protein [Streptomyces spectabilis]QDQ13086.1 CHRD domain-containing protein [Streptomyces spectabilis]
MGAITTSGKIHRRALLASGIAVVAAGAVAATVLPATADSEGGTAARGTTAAGAAGTLFVASMNGANEVPVPGGPAVGDRDGAALEFVRIRGDKVTVTATWRGTDKPTALHIHQGGKGTNGGVKVDFTGLLANAEHRRVTGTVKVRDAALLKRLKADPKGFYANLHTAQFPGGAVRGQLHKVTAKVGAGAAARGFQASVVKGEQIYQCAKGPDGRFAFAQRDVRATLGGRIAHDFVAPNSGTPRWRAPDRSAVTGKLISKTPNGATNIPELDLKAEQAGRHSGLFAHTVEILRLNTVGGVQPAGACRPGAIVSVPYGADYVFVQR